jgi:hypothetical protein
VAVRPVSVAASAFSFIWIRRSDTLSAADMATSTVEIPRCSDSCTGLMLWDSARWPWAMAQMAPLSLALLIFCRY